MYLCSENKGTDQLRGYREADLRLCFRICKKPVFSRRGSYVYEIFFRYTRAATDFAVSGWVWLKFKLIQGFMHVLVICKFKKDQINSNSTKIQ